MMTWNSMFLQSPSSELSETISTLHDYVMMFLLTVMTTIFMKLVTIHKISNFSMEFFENHQIEFIWTVVPFLILVMMAIPSLNSLYMMDSCNFCGMSVIVTGHQWYWTYYTKILNSMEFNSYMLGQGETNLRLIDTDNHLVTPTHLPIRYIVTSSDVIHSWTIPSLGFKMDAIPGRINQFCVSTKKSGLYFGQCSEICGSNHSFMPIVMESLNMKTM